MPPLKLLPVPNTSCHLQFQLYGESNSIKFDVSPQFFDCGMQPYDRIVDKEFFVHNTGKVGCAAVNVAVVRARLGRAGNGLYHAGLQLYASS